ncbi:MAG TPA: class I SAM-dependent methyltransferase [Roseiflexaceae bacterium]|nr:class I SAM-dependent methyltransferase [Roseiflexaceae bacterium]
MPSFQTIYARHAAEYDRLVSAEDYQGNLLPAIERVRPLAGADVVEAGAGTGRVTALLAPRARRVLACDISPHMLAAAAHNLRGRGNVQLAVAENRRLPAAGRSADLAIAGWSFGHTLAWEPAGWRAAIGAMVDELLRVLRPGGAAVVVETLGTGRETPAPPTPALAAYYAWLEEERGFSAAWLRTDYRFASRTAADEATGFFFGTPMPTHIAPDGAAIVHECTGIWWRRI